MLDNEQKIIHRHDESRAMDQKNTTTNIVNPLRTPAKNRKLSDVEIVLLILEVQKRHALWDFSLPIEQRNREKVQRLWDEVSTVLNGKLNATKTKKKFKSLRDTYRKIVQTEQRVRGSARIEKEKWKYYEYMEFLRDSCLIRPTNANVTADSLVGENSQEIPNLQNKNANNPDKQCSLPSTSSSRKRSRTERNNEEAGSTTNRNADVLCRDEPPVVLLPVPKQADEVESILHAVGLQLRRLPYRHRMETLLEIMQLIHNRMQTDILS